MIQWAEGMEPCLKNRRGTGAESLRAAPTEPAENRPWKRQCKRCDARVYGTFSLMISTKSGG